MSLACAHCGRLNREAAVFCDGCGKPFGGPAPAAPRLVPVTPAGDLYVGRERELAALRAALEQALAGSGRILALAGEPGIGKTRTAQVLGGLAQPLGLRVLWGRCHEEPGAPPYWPWQQILRAYIEGQQGEARAAALEDAAGHVAELVPELAPRMPDVVPATRGADPVQARYRLFDA